MSLGLISRERERVLKKDFVLKKKKKSKEKCFYIYKVYNPG